MTSADIEAVHDRQNLPLALVAGAVAALVGAGIWAGITAATNYQIGFMAVGVGFLVGLAVRKAGRGIEPRFGVVGAVFSLLGCLAGNVLTVYIVVAKNGGVPFLEALSIPIGTVLSAVKDNTTPIDFLFYAIAVYEGYRFSFDRAGATALFRKG